MKEAKKYLLDIGFDDSHLLLLFNDDDKSYYTVMELMHSYADHKLKLLDIADVTHRFSKEDLWNAWWASAIKTISFSGVDKEYERRCFEKFYENKLSALNVC